MTIDFSLDPGFPLEIVKTANKKTVMNGSILTYNISIRNNSAIPINNFIIRDNVTNGFKYIIDSTYLEKNKIDNPIFRGKNISFNNISVSAYNTINLSYQIRVGVAIETGAYKTEAVAWNLVRDWQLSNESQCQVSVIPDPLFTESTLLGRVFWDNNENGYFDVDEKGVSNAQIVMENGIIITTDGNGKYHVPAVLSGTHLLKVVLNNELKGAVCISENPRVVNVTEGMPIKINFALSKSNDSQQNQQEESQFIVSILGEGIARELKSKGNIEMVSESDKYDDGFSLDGRLALFIKGKVKGKYLITGSFDTNRSPGEIGKNANRNKLFTNLDPDKYYPVYGDSSEIDYEANDTKDELYLLVEWDESFAKWGTFNTGISTYNRSLHGANIHLINPLIINGVDFNTEVNTFLARTFHSSAQDEMLATGGSIYYLKEKGIIEGSERVNIEIKDPATKEVITSYPLIE